MEELICPKKNCGKRIEGFNKNHVQFLMMQHMLVHRNDKEEDSNSPSEKDKIKMEELKSGRTDRT